MQSQPSISEHEVNISKVQDKIRLINAGTISDNKSETKNDRSTALYAEYYQLRSDQCVSLKTQWEKYQSEQKQHRQKDIDKRQVDFDRELSSLDASRRKKWKVEDQETLTDKRRKEIYNELLSELKNFHDPKEDSENIITDTSIITLPVNLLEYFWLLDAEVPITKSELSQSICLIEDHLTKL